MKVTKLIREYIEESVAKKFEPALENLKQTYDLEAPNQAMLAVRDELRKIAVQKYREALAPFYTPEDLESLFTDRDLVSTPYSYRVSPICEKAYKEKKAALQNASDKAIKNILIELELGGTKKDLDRLLSEIKVEV